MRPMCHMLMDLDFVVEFGDVMGGKMAGGDESQGVCRHWFLGALGQSCVLHAAQTPTT